MSILNTGDDIKLTVTLMLTQMSTLDAENSIKKYAVYQLRQMLNKKENTTLAKISIGSKFDLAFTLISISSSPAHIVSYHH